MTVVLVVAAVSQPFLLTIVVSIGARLLRNERREHSRERELWTNQLFHAVRHPWQQAPADERGPAEDLSREWGRYSASPEQSPVE